MGAVGMTEADDEKDEKDDDGTGGTAPAKRGMGWVWRHTDYGKWFVADTTSSMSASIQGFVLPLVAQSLTGSATLSSLMDAIISACRAVLILPGGYVQDTVDRRTLMIAYDVVGVAVFALAGAALGFTSLGFWALVLLAVVLGCRTGLLGGTSNAMLRGIVPDQDLPKAMSLNYSRDSVIDLAGAPVGGALMVLGAWVPMAVNAVLNMLGVLASARITRYWKPGRKPGGGKPGGGKEGTDHPAPASVPASDGTRPSLRAHIASILREATSGLKYIVTTPFERRMVVTESLLFPLVNALVLITSLHINSAGTTRALAETATFNVAIAVGILLGSFLANVLVDRVRGGILVVGALALMPLCSLGVALAAGHAAIQAVLFTLAVLALPSCNAVMGGFGMLYISHGNQGRVAAAENLFGAAVTPIVTVAAGALMDWLGYGVAAMILAVLSFAAALPSATLRAIVTMPLPDQWQAHIDAHPEIKRF